MSKTEDTMSQQLMATFRIEADEHLQNLNSLLLKVEKGPDPDELQTLIENMFREAHSLKGAARAVDATFMEVIAHGLENVFAAAKQDEIITTPALFDTLYESLDHISVSLETLGSAEEADNDPAELRARLDKAAKGDPSASQKKMPANASKKKPKSTTASGGSAKKVEETIRVSTRKLDGLMTHVEELLVSKIRNEQRLSELKEIKGFLGGWQKSWAKTRIACDRIRRHSDGDLEEIVSFLGENQQNLKFMWHLTNKLFQNYSRDTMRMSLVTEDLQSDIRGVRMFPVSIIFDGYRRMVRDLAREQGKQVDLVITGSDTELDKKVVEGIKDPLMHMLRNSVDHGIEKPDARIAKGKPPCGTIWLEASQRGNGIAIEVKDDGRGVDIERIKNTVLARGILSSQEIKAMNEDDLQQMIFRSGFSTSTTVSSLSGRGVGLDVVKTNIEELNGLVSVYKGEPGGTRFLIELPLTLSTSRVLLISCRGETYAIPTSMVERIVRVNKKDIFSVGTKETITVGGRSLSLARLGPLLELPRRITSESDDTLNVIIVGVAEKRVAIAVDSLEGENEIVIKSLGKMMARVRNVSGATVLGTGKVVIILNVADLVKSAKKNDGIEAKELELQSDNRLGRTKSVLVVDDSMTARILEKNILESAGYDVVLANDGVEALRALKSNDCDLIISDIDMPNMNGFDLTQKIKNHDNHRDTPVVLVTALDSPADRERGLDAGADVFMTKHGFDQKNFLATIEQLI